MRQIAKIDHRYKYPLIVFPHDGHRKLHNIQNSTYPIIKVDPVCKGYRVWLEIIHLGDATFTNNGRITLHSIFVSGQPVDVFPTEEAEQHCCATYSTLESAIAIAEMLISLAERPGLWQ